MKRTIFSVTLATILIAGPVTGAACVDAPGSGATRYFTIDRDPTMLRARVAIGDLDLRTGAGLRAARGRVAQAAHALCRRDSGPSELVVVLRACEMATIRSTHNQLEAAIAAAKSPAYALAEIAIRAGR